MKKLLIALLVFTMGAQMHAQDTEAPEMDEKQMARMMELMGQKIEMDVDDSLFMAVSTNTYVSENPKAVIMAMMVPETYAKAKEKMNTDDSAQFKVSDRGEKTVNGVKVLFMEGTSEAEGSTLNNMVYCMEIDAETCLMFIGMVDETADAKYTEAITKTMNSVIKK
ncbi:hypothetical protein [Psychroserpens sp. Hel_I_66]|uniref:hypothetical protein n=1 Tax=Psychroserpens sp. Hel_I_66 TaxID=1250004 RepID=UPI000648F822|nr:hypothetical protein [Psychroserpens sp. Hel_I_66]